LDQHEPKIRSTEQGSILCEISTARALRQRSRELSKHAHYFTLSNHHHHWLPPSLVTTLFIDRPSRPQNLSISGKYVLVYCLFVIKAKILPRPDTDERLQVLPKQAVVHDTLQSGLQALPLAHHLEPLLLSSINLQIVDSIHRSTRRAPLHFVERDNT
jgi:hypothetical protein